MTIYPYLHYMHKGPYEGSPEDGDELPPNPARPKNKPFDCCWATLRHLDNSARRWRPLFVSSRSEIEIIVSRAVIRRLLNVIMLVMSGFEFRSVDAFGRDTKKN